MLGCSWFASVGTVLLEFYLTLLQNMLKPCRVAISLERLAYGSHIHALLKDGLSFILLASVSL